MKNRKNFERCRAVVIVSAAKELPIRGLFQYFCVKYISTCPIFAYFYLTNRSLMLEIACNLSRIRASLPESVTLVAVSKTHPAEAIRQAFDAGHRIFGESRPQELCAR